MAETATEAPRPCSGCGGPIRSDEYRLLLVGQGATGLPVYFFVHATDRCRGNLPAAGGLRLVGSGWLA